MSDDLQRVCATCHYCRMDTEAESVAMYGRALGYGTCYRHGGDTVKAPAAATCADWWSPLEAPTGQHPTPTTMPGGATTPRADMTERELLDVQAFLLRQYPDYAGGQP